MVEWNCNTCKYKAVRIGGEPCCDCGISQNYHKPMSQADRIRAMSDEELAEFLSENTNCDCCKIQCKDKLNCPSMSSCYCRWAEWLKSEAKE